MAWRVVVGEACFPSSTDSEVAAFQAISVDENLKDIPNIFKETWTWTSPSFLHDCIGYSQCQMLQMQVIVMASSHHLR